MKNNLYFENSKINPFRDPSEICKSIKNYSSNLDLAKNLLEEFSYENFPSLRSLSDIDNPSFTKLATREIINRIISNDKRNNLINKFFIKLFKKVLREINTFSFKESETKLFKRLLSDDICTFTFKESEIFNSYIAKTGSKVLEASKIKSKMRDTGHCIQNLMDLDTLDCVIEILKNNNYQLSSEKKYLDFGCNTGRFPMTLFDYLIPSEGEIFGCDPQINKIKKAKNLAPHISYFGSPVKPPLKTNSNYFDGIFSFSVWTHFSESSAILWLKEISRILKPQGFLILTTKGPAALLQHLLRGKQSGGGLNNWLQKCERNLPGYTDQLIKDFIKDKFLFTTFCYSDPVSSEDWGQTFYSSEILKKHALKANLKLLDTLHLAWGERRQDMHILVKND